MFIKFLLKKCVVNRLKHNKFEVKYNNVYVFSIPQGQQKGLNLFLLFWEIHIPVSLVHRCDPHMIGNCTEKIIYCSWFRFCDKSTKLSSSWRFHLRYDYCPRCQWWWRKQEEVLYYSPMSDNHNTFPILQLNFLVLHKETFSLYSFDKPGCLVAIEGKKKKKKPPTALTGIWFLFPRQTHTSARCRLNVEITVFCKITVYVEILALEQSAGLRMKCMFERKWYNSEGVISVIIDPQPDISHKWKLAFGPERNQKWGMSKCKTNL